MKKFILITTLLTTTGLAGISYADCTQEEMAHNYKLVMEYIFSEKVPSDQYDYLEDQIEQASIAADKDDLSEACKIYGDIVKKYNLTTLN